MKMKVMWANSMLTSDEARARLFRILKGEGTPRSEPHGPAQQISLPSEEFPVPGLIFIALKTLLGLESYGPEEKMAWGIAATYGQTGFAIHFEKFGLQLYVSETTDRTMIDEIIRALRKCCSVAESYMATELDSARVTIRNQYHRFKDAYQFFRKLAREAYAGSPPDPVVKETPFGTMTSSQPFRPQQEGGYLASAMLDAYFSKLEHVLVLMSAFSGLELENGGLRNFVGDRWDENSRRSSMLVQIKRQSVFTMI